MIHPPKTNMTGWEISIFNRKYIDSNGWIFSIVMLVLGGEYII